MLPEELRKSMLLFEENSTKIPEKRRKSRLAAKEYIKKEKTKIWVMNKIKQEFGKDA